MTTLDIATASHKDTKHWDQGKIDWSKLAEWVEHPATEKDCGSYVLGVLRGGRRTRATVVSRCAVTLDADYARPDLPDAIEQVHGWAAIIHTTFRSSPEALRLRLARLRGPLERARILELARWKGLVSAPLRSGDRLDELERAAATLLQPLGGAAADVGRGKGATQRTRVSAAPRDCELPHR